MTRIKICGLTNLEDALACQTLGVDYLGFVFADSPRKADPAVVRQIRCKLDPAVKTVGVFTEESERVLQIVDACLLDYVQLHGNQSEAFAQRIGAQRVIRVIKISEQHDWRYIEEYRSAAYYLFDTYSRSLQGGTGATWDWDILEGHTDIMSRAFVAGGINPDNVIDVISKLRPFAIDAASAVEERPGKKDLSKLERLVKNVTTFDNFTR